MASTISLNDLAPADQTIHFTLATEEFDLGGSAKKSFSTSDPDVVADAVAHPWLKVDSSSSAVDPTFVDNQVHPEDDPFSRFGPNAGIANDPDEIAKAEAAKATADLHPVAIDAGKDQNEKVVTGGVAETVAADEDATAAKSAAAFKGTEEAAVAAAAPPAPDAPAPDTTSTDSKKDS